MNLPSFPTKDLVSSTPRLLQVQSHKSRGTGPLLCSWACPGHAHASGLVVRFGHSPVLVPSSSLLVLVSCVHVYVSVYVYSFAFHFFVGVFSICIEFRLCFLLGVWRSFMVSTIFSFLRSTFVSLYCVRFFVFVFLPHFSYVFIVHLNFGLPRLLLYVTHVSSELMLLKVMFCMSSPSCVMVLAILFCLQHLYVSLNVLMHLLGVSSCSFGIRDFVYFSDCVFYVYVCCFHFEHFPKDL